MQQGAACFLNDAQLPGYGNTIRARHRLP